jgi:hypothetical protein
MFSASAKETAKKQESAPAAIVEVIPVDKFDYVKVDKINKFQCRLLRKKASKYVKAFQNDKTDKTDDKNYKFRKKRYVKKIIGSKGASNDKVSQNGSLNNKRLKLAEKILDVCGEKLAKKKKKTKESNSLIEDVSAKEPVKEA